MLGLFCYSGALYSLALVGGFFFVLLCANLNGFVVCLSWVSPFLYGGLEYN